MLLSPSFRSPKNYYLTWQRQLLQNILETETQDDSFSFSFSHPTEEITARRPHPCAVHRALFLILQMLEIKPALLLLLLKKVHNGNTSSLEVRHDFPQRMERLV